MDGIKAKRTAAFYDEYPNCRIRERMGMMKSGELAQAINERLPGGTKVSAEAVRQWSSGYARPDVSKLAIIAEVLECSTDYLLGLEDARTHDLSFICEQTGLSEKAVDALMALKYYIALYEAGFDSEMWQNFRSERGNIIDYESGLLVNNSKALLRVIDLLLQGTRDPLCPESRLLSCINWRLFLRPVESMEYKTTAGIIAVITRDKLGGVANAEVIAALNKLAERIEQEESTDGNGNKD